MTALDSAATAQPRGAVPAKPFKSWVMVAGGLLALMFITRLLAEWHLAFPACWLRKLTGIPCPTCGCTRSLVAWTELDLNQAFFFNPLFFLFCAGALLWPTLIVLEKVVRRDWISRTWMGLVRRRVWLWPIFAVLVVLNWLYLWLRLPK